MKLQADTRGQGGGIGRGDTAAPCRLSKISLLFSTDKVDRDSTPTYNAQPRNWTNQTSVVHRGMPRGLSQSRQF